MLARPARVGQVPRDTLHPAADVQSLCGTRHPLAVTLQATVQEMPLSPNDPALPAPVAGATIPAPAEDLQRERPSVRVHLVVVTTRALDAHETTPASNALRTRFWHPKDHRWSENDFASLEHALRLFVDVSGWVLLQDQALDAPLASEWIFEAHRIDFTRATKEQILSDIGLTPEGVTRLLEDVSERPPAA
jgi:hypothetical protein